MKGRLTSKSVLPKLNLRNSEEPRDRELRNGKKIEGTEEMKRRQKKMGGEVERKEKERGGRWK